MITISLVLLPFWNFNSSLFFYGGILSPFFFFLSSGFFFFDSLVCRNPPPQVPCEGSLFLPTPFFSFFRDCFPGFFPCTPKSGITSVVVFFCEFFFPVLFLVVLLVESVLFFQHFFFSFPAQFLRVSLSPGFPLFPFMLTIFSSSAGFLPGRLRFFFPLLIFLVASVFPAFCGFFFFPTGNRPPLSVLRPLSDSRSQQTFLV